MANERRKKTILEQFYDGELNPQEQITVKDPEYRAVIRRIEQEEKHFISKMSLDDCQRFQAFKNLYVEVSDIHSRAAFCHGFKMGGSMIAEALTDGEPLSCTEEQLIIAFQKQPSGNGGLFPILPIDH